MTPSTNNPHKHDQSLPEAEEESPLPPEEGAQGAGTRGNLILRKPKKKRQKQKRR